MSDYPGRELTATSVLGPLLSVSLFAEEDPQVAEKCFSEVGDNPSALASNNIDPAVASRIKSTTAEQQQEIELHRVRGVINSS